MHIFCRETEAHLQLHPHLNDLKNNKEGTTLITPDLWLKDCEESRTKDLPREHSKDTDGECSDEEKRNASFIPHETEKPRLSSCSSFGDASPVSLFDDTEPVNLSTSQPLQQEASKRCQKFRGYKWGEEPRPRTNSRYGRPPKIASTDVGSLQSKMRAPKTSPSGESFEGKPKGMIRVRQLEEQSRSREGDASISSSVSSSGTSALPGLTGFGGLLMGARPPLMPGISNLLHPPPPSEIPRPQILPQLLLSHPDLLRLQGMRPSFILPQPSIQPPQPTPTIPPPLPSQPLPPPPPPPLPLPATNPPKPLGFPPVTVLLPLPLPIPIPIPVPIPIPIPIKDSNQSGPNRKEDTSEGESLPIPNLPQEGTRKERKIDTLEASAVDHKGSGASSSVLLERLSLNKLEKESQHKEESTESFQPELSLPKNERKERRSILRYTSDVYEINGVFVPRGGGWDSLPVQAPLSEKKDDEVHSAPGGLKPVAPPKLKGNPLPRTEGGAAKVATNTRKRPPPSESGDRNQPLPKKKHLLT